MPPLSKGHQVNLTRGNFSDTAPHADRMTASETGRSRFGHIYWREVSRTDSCTSQTRMWSERKWGVRADLSVNLAESCFCWRLKSPREILLRVEESYAQNEPWIKKKKKKKTRLKRRTFCELSAPLSEGKAVCRSRLFESLPPYFHWLLPVCRRERWIARMFSLSCTTLPPSDLGFRRRRSAMLRKCNDITKKREAEPSPATFREWNSFSLFILYTENSRGNNTRLPHGVNEFWPLSPSIKFNYFIILFCISIPSAVICAAFRGLLSERQKICFLYRINICSTWCIFLLGICFFFYCVITIKSHSDWFLCPYKHSVGMFVLYSTRVHLQILAGLVILSLSFFFYLMKPVSQHLNVITGASSAQQNYTITVKMLP